MKTLFENKFIRVWEFKNTYKKHMIGLEFVVGEASRNDYRGFEATKAKKVARWFRKIAKKLDRVC